MPLINEGVKKIIFTFAAIAAATGLYFILHGFKKNIAQNNAPPPLSRVQVEEPKLPKSNDQLEKNQLDEKEKPAPDEPLAKNIPEKFLLEIPFYSQAPLANWDAFHEEMCEEASILNAAYYLLGKKPSLEKYEEELQKVQKFEKKEIGEWKSSTIAQMKKFVDIYFEEKIKSKTIETPTIDEIEAEIAAGYPVIIPLSGRDIGNPNFTPPGPVYHMLVIKGYDNQNFITNDVGTRKGNSYPYKKETLMKNMHDWNEADIHKGEKRVLVLYK